MKITIIDPTDESEEIIVKCHQISSELMNLLNAFKAREGAGHFLIAYKEAEIHRVNPDAVFYIESVDNKTYLYCEHQVFESKQKLYELESLEMQDFFRASKSVIINLSKIKTLIPALSGRLEAVLTNGERVIISRQYVSKMKKILGM